MAIITQKSLKELNVNGVNYAYALSPNGRDFFLSSSGRTYGEAFDNFAGLLDEECRGYAGVCEVRETDKDDKGLVVLIGRIISTTQLVQRSS